MPGFSPTKSSDYKEALNAFITPYHEFTVEAIPDGLINQSFKITSSYSGESFLLQQINRQVFHDPESIESNYQLLWNWLRTKDIQFRLPEPKTFADESHLYFDSNKNCWRVFEFIQNAQTFSMAENIFQAKAVARTFGGMTASFEKFKAEKLEIVIPRFHDLSFRFQQFEKSLHSGNYDRLRKAAPFVEQVQQRKGYVNLYEVMTESSEFPKRVMHHDAKISNVLFDEESGKVICPVDMDTVMPGFFFSDLGDMIRSMTPDKDENSIDEEGPTVREEYYEAILSGYLEEMEPILTNAEKKYIHYSGIFLIYMQAMRFLSDYLAGDIYYKVKYASQNLDRAKNQLKLLISLEEWLKKKAII